MKNLLTIFGLLIAISSFAQDWEEINSPIQNSSIADIVFINTDTGFLVTGNDFANPHYFRTINGGQSWDSIPLSYTSWFSKYVSTSDNVGFMVGGAAFAFPPAYCSNLILKTTNAGLTFDSLHADYSGGTIIDAAFADADNGFFTGDFISLQTNDGGNTFDTIAYSTSFNSRQTEFPDLEHAYLLTSTYLGNGNNDYNLLFSENVGQSWDTINIGVHTPFSEMNFVTPENGFIAGYSGKLISITNSTDISSITVDTNINFTDVQFINENVGFLTATDNTTQDGYFYSTQDAGATWTIELIDTNFYTSTFALIENKVYVHNGYKILTNTIDTTTSVGVKDISLASLNIYPNPSQDFVQIDIPEGLVENSTIIQIIDITGKVVLQKNFVEESNLIDVTYLSTGSYCVNVTDGEKPLVFGRLIKN